MLGYCHVHFVSAETKSKIWNPWVEKIQLEGYSSSNTHASLLEAAPPNRTQAWGSKSKSNQNKNPQNWNILDFIPLNSPVGQYCIKVSIDINIAESSKLHQNMFCLTQLNVRKGAQEMCTMLHKAVQRIYISFSTQCDIWGSIWS